MSLLSHLLGSDSDAIWHKCHIAAPCHGPINKEKQDLSEVLLFLVIPTRFERVTHSLEGCCSIQLSYGTILFLLFANAYLEPR